MKKLCKPFRLCKGDTIATVSPCNGWAGDEVIRWKYELGVMRLRELGLNVAPAPNSLRGSDFLSRNPQARAEDIMWAFENHEVRAVIANVGGNDSIKVVPYVDPRSIRNNPKIFIGYSDVMNLHILCYKCGLSSFYGDNLLEPIGDARGWHEYSRRWFEKALFDDSPLGLIEPSAEWAYGEVDYTDRAYARPYHAGGGYELLQGQGAVRGRLFGGHTGLMELDDTVLKLAEEDFRETILFLEDIPEFFTVQALRDFLNWLDRMGALRVLRGILIGRVNSGESFEEQKTMIKDFFAERGLSALPILYGANFGHSSPVCVLPYGAAAEINCAEKSFSVLESGVVSGPKGQEDLSDSGKWLYNMLGVQGSLGAGNQDAGSAGQGSAGNGGTGQQEGTRGSAG